MTDVAPYVSRTGKVTEYKAGHYYVTRTEWDDGGHVEIEVHRCVPHLLFHSCDPKEWEAAKEQANELARMERQEVTLIGRSQS